MMIPSWEGRHRAVGSEVRNFQGRPKLVGRGEGNRGEEEGKAGKCWVSWQVKEWLRWIRGWIWGSKLEVRRPDEGERGERFSVLVIYWRLGTLRSD